jgi:hypothetical protein
VKDDTDQVIYKQSFGAINGVEILNVTSLCKEPFDFSEAFLESNIK